MKYLDDRHKINEYIGGRLAKILDIPVPEFSFVEITSSSISKINSSSVAYYFPRGVTPKGIGFASRKLADNGQKEVITTLPSSLKLPTMYANAHEFALNFLKIVLFDIWLVNIDRNIDNTNSLVVEKEGYLSLFAIDHVQIFNGGHYLDLKADENYKLTKSDTLLELPVFGEIKDKLGNQFDSEIDKILGNFENIVNTQIQEIFKDLPEEWDFSEEENNKVTDFILQRKNLIKNHFYSII
ncbi:MAG: hypothetical protein K1X86_10340 [Ignavibacteria bacterium]|nr:hypothetical protein [Ignavibacteria bacterium]